MKVAGLLVLVAAATAGCGSTPGATPVGNSIIVGEAGSTAASNAATNAATTTSADRYVSSSPSIVADTGFVPSGPAPEPRPDPDLGQFTDQAALIEALSASGPLDNQLPDTTDGLIPSHSICADIAQYNEPGAGKVVHEAIATLNGQTGVVLVFQRTDGGREVRMYGTGEADPATGGCLLWLQAPL